MSDEYKQDQVRETQYDGIQEYDNNLPNWWLGTFFCTLLFGMVYWVHFQVFQTGDSQKNEFAKEQSIFQKSFKLPDDTGVVDENMLLTLLKDNHEKEEGKKIFDSNCVSCHGAHGEGGIGPNLTDEYWIHGGKPERVYHTILQGVPEKGMISWKQVLQNEKLTHVTVYVLSLQGTNPANPKPPQGKLEK